MAEDRGNGGVQIAVISVGVLVALICAFFLGAVFMRSGVLFPAAYEGPSALVPVAPMVLPSEPAAERMPEATSPKADERPAASKPPATPKVKKPVFPHMQLQAQYAGPFADTLIQRWRDPIDGRICYVYLPANVKHAPMPADGGFLDYGANDIGSISCGPPASAKR